MSAELAGIAIQEVRTMTHRLHAGRETDPDDLETSVEHARQHLVEAMAHLEAAQAKRGAGLPQGSFASLWKAESEAGAAMLLQSACRLNGSELGS